MKKSELLALLKQDIKDAAGDLDLQANIVLSRCISVGMLPPHLHTAKLHGYIWEPEIKEELYGESVVVEINDDIKALNKTVDSSEEM